MGTNAAPTLPGTVALNGGGSILKWVRERGVAPAETRAERLTFEEVGDEYLLRMGDVREIALKDGKTFSVIVCTVYDPAALIKDGKKVVVAEGAHLSMTAKIKDIYSRFIGQDILLAYVGDVPSSNKSFAPMKDFSVTLLD